MPPILVHYSLTLDLTGRDDMMGTVKQFLEQHPEITLVRFVLWDAAALKAYERAAQELFVA